MCHRLKVNMCHRLKVNIGRCDVTDDVDSDPEIMSRWSSSSSSYEMEVRVWNACIAILQNMKTRVIF